MLAAGPDHLNHPLLRRSMAAPPMASSPHVHDKRLLSNSMQACRCSLHRRSFRAAGVNHLVSVQHMLPNLPRKRTMYQRG
jgi:hypothetical protein